jgi:hypothetical protein
MKKSYIKYLILPSLVIFSLSACDGGGEADFDGFKSLEGRADPANTGGKWGGSQAPVKRLKLKDSTRVSREV